MMVNVKQELLEDLSMINESTVKCAWVTHKDITVSLKVQHSKQEYEKFLKDLDFEYDYENNGKDLLGVIWLNDQTWCDRCEYEDYVTWEHRTIPQIPIFLLLK